MSDLTRFVDAQARVMETVLAELRAGRKATHWMWYVFPQIAGLGTSALAERFALEDLDEARAFLAHPVLGARLLECTRAVLGHAGTPLRTILGTPDDLKFRSCMTLFAAADPSERLFRDALDTFCSGEPDPRTLEELGSEALPGAARAPG